jgi:hypothetical protein
MLGTVCATAVLAAPALADPSPAAIVTGLDEGWPDVRAWEPNGAPALQFAPWGQSPIAFSPYATYQQGVRVAVGDVNGDGRMDIVTAPGKDAFTELKVFDGRTFRQLGTLLPFKDGAWWAGAYVATGDTNGDGRAEIVEGLDAGCCTTLHVLDAVDGTDLSGFFPYGDHSEVGARVAAGDLNGDGKSEILAVPLGSTRINAFAPTGGAPFRTIDAFGSEISGPISIAAGNLSGDARTEIVAAAPTYAGAEIKIIDPATGDTRNTLYPYGGEAVSSVAVALGDVDGDGRLDIVLCAVTPQGTEVKVLKSDGVELSEFYVLNPAIVPGASLAAGDLNGDGKAEIVLGGGPTTAPWPPVANGPDQRVAVYEGDGTQAGEFTAYPGLFQGGVRVALADLTHDRRPEMITAPGPGTEPEIGIFTQQWVNGRDRGTRLAHFLAFDRSFRGGLTIAAGDVNADGSPELVVGSGKGRPAEVRVFDGDGRLLYSFQPFGATYDGGVSVAAGDLNADGRAEIVVGTLAGPARIRVFDGSAPEGPVIAPFASDSPGVHVAVADLDGNARGVIFAGETSGDHPRLALVDPQSGTVIRSGEIGDTMSGLRVAAGDLDHDGRDELVVTSGFGGDSRVHILNASLAETSSFAAYDWFGAGMNVAVATRLGFPIAAETRTVRLKAAKRSRFVIARFRDAGEGTVRLKASIAWGNGTFSTGTVLVRSGGVYDIRVTKRFRRPGGYSAVVTVADPAGRTSIARSRAVVVRR